MPLQKPVAGNRQPHPVTPICREFNSPTGCQLYGLAVASSLCVNLVSRVSLLPIPWSEGGGGGGSRETLGTRLPVCIISNCNKSRPQHEHLNSHTGIWLSPTLQLTYATRVDSDMDFILHGITNGFHLISPASILTPAEVTNYRSATSTDVLDKVEKQIRDEIQLGNYVITKTKLSIVSADGAIPKPNSDNIPNSTHTAAAQNIATSTRTQLCNDSLTWHLTKRSRLSSLMRILPRWTSKVVMDTYLFTHLFTPLQYWLGNLAERTTPPTGMIVITFWSRKIIENISQAHPSYDKARFSNRNSVSYILSNHGRQWK